MFIPVVSGDHGFPGFPRAKCNLYDIGCQVAMAARWPGRIRPGRVVEDFVNLMDLGPTFMEAADVTVPVTMTGKSLLPVFESDTSGQVDPDRTFVVTGRERHVSIISHGALLDVTNSSPTSKCLHSVQPSGLAAYFSTNSLWKCFLRTVIRTRWFSESFSLMSAPPVGESND